MLIAVLASTTVRSQSYSDTLYLNGPSSEKLSEYTKYWIDFKEDKNSLDRALKARENNEFKRWPNDNSLNTGLTKNPVWVSLNIQHNSEIYQTYWWSVYSHADSIILYKKGDDEKWFALDSAMFQEKISDRDIKVRFLATKIDLDPNKKTSLLLKIINYRKPLNAVMDITTGEHNLLWEMKFFWSIGFIVGGLVLLACLNLFLGIISSSKLNLVLGIYIIIVVIITLQEEFLQVFYPSQYLHQTLMRLSGGALTLIGCGLHFYVIDQFFQKISDKFNPMVKVMRIVAAILTSYAILFLVIDFIIYNEWNLTNSGFSFFWNLNILLIFIMLVLFFLRIIVSAQNTNNLIWLIPLAGCFTYFNSASYFLNYEGVINSYEITYPNYFYMFLFTEFAGMGIFMAYRYRKIIQDNLRLEKEKAISRTQFAEQIAAIQERERLQIARDLHDDLGTTLSAIKLVVTNSYFNDSHLVNMISKATKDLRFYLSNFSVSSLEDGIFQAMHNKIAEIPSFSDIKFKLITSGDDKLIGDQLNIAIYRILSELITNILKHSQATNAIVQIIIDEESVELMIEDNGTGYNTDLEFSGMGLENIRNRTENFNGKLHIVSDSRSGTTVIIKFPLEKMKYEKV